MLKWGSAPGSDYTRAGYRYSQATGSKKIQPIK